MPRFVILDEIHVSLLVPRGLPDPETQTIWLAVNDVRFDKELRRAIRRLIRRRVARARVRIRVYR